jgi:hypothetical protein
MAAVSAESMIEVALIAVQHAIQIIALCWLLTPLQVAGYTRVLIKGVVQRWLCRVFPTRTIQVGSRRHSDRSAWRLSA